MFCNIVLHSPTKTCGDPCIGARVSSVFSILASWESSTFAWREREREREREERRRMQVLARTTLPLLLLQLRQPNVCAFQKQRERK
jgi:hypothetical protein